MNDDAPNMERLKQIFEATIGALHALHRHSQYCPGCERCPSIQADAQDARDRYRLALRKTIG